MSGREIVVAGGYVEDGSTTARADLTTRSRTRGARGPEPAAAAEPRGRGDGEGRGGGRRRIRRRGGPRPRQRCSSPPTRGARYRRCRSPTPAAAAAALNGRLYVVGGVAASGLAKAVLAYDPARAPLGRGYPGPTPRQHLAATATRGRIYAIAGRTAGYDTNTRARRVVGSGREALAPGTADPRSTRRHRGRNRPAAWSSRSAASRRRERTSRVRLRRRGPPLAPPPRSAVTAPRPRRRGVRQAAST